MKLLAIDTSTEACSVALWHDGEVCSRYELAPRGHTDLVLGMVEAVLAEAQVAKSALEAVAFGRGPGSFTGVRIGTGVVQGIAYGLDIPVVPLSTLAILAQGAVRRHGREQIMAAIDARMGEVYYAAFEVQDGLVCEQLTERVCAPGAVPDVGGAGWYGVGSGWQAYPELAERYGRQLDGWEEAFPDATDAARLGVHVAALGGVMPVEQALPVYLRDKVVHGR